MCSGCSGDYAGDFEDSDETTHDSCGDPPAWAKSGPEGNGNALVTRGFESPESSRRNSQRRSSPVAENEAGEEICEIMVSATRIVEVRVVSANPEEVYEFSRGEAARKLPADKQSEAASAKYYQTPAGTGGVAGDCDEVHIVRGFAACAMGEIKKWSRWARNALGKERRKSFTEFSSNREARWKHKK